MKALIIADSDTLIDFCCDTLKNAGYELIIYHWLLKALDNIEEIAPDIIIIDASSYPRHWKTLVQYTRAISEDKIDFFLFTLSPLSEDEKAKATSLKIKKVFQLNNTDSFVQYFLPKRPKEASREPILSQSNKVDIECLFELEQQGIITGKVSSFDGKTIVFVPDSNIENIDTLSEKKIDNVVIKELADDNIYSTTANILSSDSTSLTMEIAI